MSRRGRPPGRPKSAVKNKSPIIPKLFDRERTCMLDGLKFSDLKSYESHLDQMHTEVLIKKCIFCPYENRQRELVFEHIFRLHSLRPILNVTSCPNCLVFKATSLDLINFHLQNCPPKSEINGGSFRIVPEKSSPTKIVLSRKAITTTTTTPPAAVTMMKMFCHICDFCTSDQTLFGLHLAQNHLVFCKICRFSTMSEELLMNHSKTEHPEQSQNGDNVPPQKSLLKRKASSTDKSLAKKPSADKLGPSNSVGLSRQSPRKKCSKNGFDSLNMASMSMHQSAENGDTETIVETSQNGIDVIPKPLHNGDVKPQLVTKGQKNAYQELNPGTEKKKRGRPPKKLKIAEKNGAKPEEMAATPEEIAVTFSCQIVSAEKSAETPKRPRGRPPSKKTETILKKDDQPKKAMTKPGKILEKVDIKTRLTKPVVEVFKKPDEEMLKKLDNEANQAKYLPRDLMAKLQGNKCLDCNFVGIVRFDTIRHIRNVHLKTKFFHCNYCHFSNTYLRKLKDHHEAVHEGQAEHSGLQQAQIKILKIVHAPLDLAHAKFIQTNAKQTNCKPLNTMLSMVVRPLENGRVSKMRPLIRRFFKCPHCSHFKSEVQQEFLKHLQNSHKSPKPPEEGHHPLPPNPDESWAFRQLLTDGGDVGKTCILCKFEHQDPSVLQDHMSIHVDFKSLKCLACEWKSPDLAKLGDHLRACEKSNLKFQRFLPMLKCALCEFSTESDQALIHHVNLKHSNASLNGIVTDLICPICYDFEGADQVELSKHLRKCHSKEIGTKCCFCDEERSTLMSVMRHIDTVHFDIRKYPCTVCNHRFTCSRDLKNHLYVHAMQVEPK